jgi:glycosyltransferase involved in cell wall biosynthesis
VVGFGNLPKQYSEAYKTPSVEFVGEVNDVKPWYNKAAISVVPLLTGSGTRLKILEAMGLGVPVISTSVGAEGIAYTDGGDILIADNEQVFAEKIIQLARCKKERLKIQENALKLVKKIYDWNVIGRSMAEFINN